MYNYLAEFVRIRLSQYNGKSCAVWKSIMKDFSTKIEWKNCCMEKSNVISEKNHLGLNTAEERFMISSEFNIQHDQYQTKASRSCDR
ncbi:CLUMA_CG008217, isoform A [Clunio marinus]|uniref:CLUMA_CG008217, isoform A n=1 Tax=Clunio marinus TaxID=568069 RepID=A0A1J1I345_9DIPT|nr:CLUMA_CG008217, isoform A [Clunio marinus]